MSAAMFGPSNEPQPLSTAAARGLLPGPKEWPLVKTASERVVPNCQHPLELFDNREDMVEKDDDCETRQPGFQVPARNEPSNPHTHHKIRMQLFPRSSERGPIEACQRVRVRATGRGFPRSSERGPIEAASHVPGP